MPLRFLPHAPRQIAARGLATLILILGTATPVAAEETSDVPTVLTKEQLAAEHGLAVSDIHDVSVPGFYEVVTAGRVVYLSVDGRLLFRGDVIDLRTKANLTEERRAMTRAAALATIDPATEIVFSPGDGAVKHRVTIFTDVDCGYCRQFHREIAAVNALGIEVRYVSYPRTGPKTESWEKAQGVWCAEDRREALTAAKRGTSFSADAACAAVVADHYNLGREIAVTGTPAIYTDSGIELGGYLPPAELLAELEKIDGKR